MTKKVRPISFLMVFFYALLLFLTGVALTSCNNNSDYKFNDVTPVDYKGHSFIAPRTGTYQSWLIHDPECPRCKDIRIWETKTIVESLLNEYHGRGDTTRTHR